jgi:hypothetical protein
MRSRLSTSVLIRLQVHVLPILPLLFLSVAACDKTTPPPQNADAGTSSDAARSDAGVAVDTRLETFDSRAPDAQQSVGDFGQRYLRTLCKKLFGCCPAEALSNLGPFGVSEESCVAAGEASGFSEALETELNAELRVGAVIYDEVKMMQCLADLAAWSCASIRKPGSDFFDLPTCKMALRGTRTTGESCNTDFACVQGWCDVGAGSVCADPLPNGEACLLGSECQGRECSEDSGTCVTATVDTFCSE